MDSFYEQPRKLPASRTASAATEKIVPSLVPDASLLLQNSGNIPQRRAEMSYNAWKIQRQHPHHQLLPNKENLNPHPSQPSLYRKQVRFESPQGAVENRLRPTIPTNGPILRRIAPPIQHHPKAAPSNILQEKPFEKIYMANIPNRHLDLSIIEPPRNASNVRSKHIAESTTIGLVEDRNVGPVRFEGKIFDTQINLNSFGDKLPGYEALNDKNCTNKINEGRNYGNQHDIAHEIETRVAQINGLQTNTNVAKLVETRNGMVCENNKDLHTEPNGGFIGGKLDQCRLNQFQSSSNTRADFRNPQTAIVSTADPDEPSVKDLLKIIQSQNEQLMTLQQQVSTLLQDRYEPQRHLMETPVMMDGGRNALPKFAIDVMTSFEVSIRPQNNRIFNNREFPKIQEITDDELDKSGKHDVSLSLREPLVVRQDCPSPEHSIHVDMQDFSSDSEDDDTSRSSLIGWTIYNNVMGQVNHLLKKSNGDATNTPMGGFNKPTMQKVKETTLRHLQNVGVKLNGVDRDESIDSDASLECSPTEISYAVKQLLMKYLPDEHLTKITENTRPSVPANYPKNLIKRRPDFSMATVQYMEKYNLLNNDNGPTKSFPKRQLIKDGKMLDITALKQQPKLL